MGKYFGTDGVRGIANEQLTSNLAYRIGRFLGQYPNGKKNKILIGRDTRVSGAMLFTALTSGITASGSDVYDLEITSTPSVSYLVEVGDFDYGVMISASHNPFFDNGIKIFSPNGEKLSHDIELLIEDYIDSEKDYLPLASSQKIGHLICGKDLIDNYLDFLAKSAKPGIEKLNVAFDCAHGSTAAVAKHLFSERLHINATYINDTFTGYDINNNCGSTHIEALSQFVKNGHYDLGAAFDGDGDRLMIVDENGNVIDGDGIMFLSALNLKNHNELKEDKVVITVMSNIGLKKALEAKGLGFEIVDVGDKYVQACIKEKNLSLGGEQSGHVIYNKFLNTGDGMLSAIQVMNAVIDENKKVSELVKDLTIYPQVLKNVGVANKDIVMVNPDLQLLIENAEKDLQGDGRILVRPSGTEQLIRVMVEAKTLEICNEITTKIADFITSISY